MMFLLQGKTIENYISQNHDQFRNQMRCNKTAHENEHPVYNTVHNTENALVFHTPVRQHIQPIANNAIHPELDYANTHWMVILGIQTT